MIVSAYFRLIRAGYVLAREGALSIPGELPPALAPLRFGIWLGRLIGARTIWIDSVANAEVLSLAGRKIGPLTDLWLTQWPHLATKNGPLFHGSVI